jgi:hypothetical protein
MIFHVKPPAPQGMGPGSSRAGQYIFSVIRAILALLFLAALFTGAYFAHTGGWSEGATTLLHMAEVAFGGVTGLIIGERLALTAS